MALTARLKMTTRTELYPPFHNVSTAVSTSARPQAKISRSKLDLVPDKCVARLPYE